MKAKFKDSFETLCKHVQRHNGLMIIASSIVTALALFFTIYWNFDENNLGVVVDYLYLAGHIFFLVTSALLTALLIISKHIKIKESFLVIYIHLYVLLLIAWVTMDCVLDMKYGLSPQFYLMIFTAVAPSYGQRWHCVWSVDSQTATTGRTPPHDDRLRSSPASARLPVPPMYP